MDRSLKGWKGSTTNCAWRIRRLPVGHTANFDPMGIRTVESIVVTSSQTLHNDEHYCIRHCALKVMRRLGVAGECNAVRRREPNSREFRNFDVNARLSRSSALASKATGYSLAYVSDVVNLHNSVTRCTTAGLNRPSTTWSSRCHARTCGSSPMIDTEVGSCMRCAD